MKIGANHELVPHLPLSAPKDDKGVRKENATLAERMSDGGWAPLRLKRADRHERPRQRQQSLTPSVEVLRELPPVRLIGSSVETDSTDVHALAIQLRGRLSIDEAGSADEDQGSPSSPAQSADAGTSQVLPSEYTNPKLSARIEGGNKQYLFEGKPVFPSYPHGDEKPEKEFGMPRMEVGRGKFNVVTERYNERASVYRKSPHNEYVATDLQRVTQRGRVLDDVTRVLLGGDAETQKMSRHFANELLKEVRHGEPIYLTRAVNGITLKQHFRTMGHRREVSPESLREKATELFSAIDWLRGKGYFHANLTLENIMLDRSSGKLVLIDLESIQRHDASTQQDCAKELRELKDVLAHHLGD